MFCIIHDAELTWRYAMDAIRRMDDEAPFTDRL